jgi:hypothetical protein
MVGTSPTMTTALTREPQPPFAGKPHPGTYSRPATFLRRGRQVVNASRLGSGGPATGRDKGLKTCPF